MAKIFVTIKGVHVLDGNPHLIYEAQHFDDAYVPFGSLYGSDFKLIPQDSLAENERAMKEKIANYAVDKGLKVSTGDVITYGAPIFTDSNSFSNKINGMTSDVSAVKKELIPKDAQPTMTARAMDSFSRAFNWMMG